ETGLTPPERIGLLGDRWALLRAGQGTVADFLDLVMAVKRDPNATVMENALSRVETIRMLIATDEDRERLNAIVRRELGSVYAAMGGASKHESYDHAELRETLFEALGKARDPAALAEADRLARALFLGQKPDDPMIGDAAVALVTRTGDAAMYDKLQRVAQNATDPDLKEAALHVLTRFEDSLLVMRTLLYAVSDKVRNQDSWTLIALLLERRETQDLAWEFVQQHWPEIQKKSTVSSGTRIVEAAGTFCTVEKRDSVAEFFGAHPAEGSGRALSRALDSINDCIHLRAAQEPELRRWLDTHGGS
ncbi:MAG TPA: ERAP1-like C-terminal domain-containing protein, partial [Steroidobacteraceae bacterium]